MRAALISFALLAACTSSHEFSLGSLPRDAGTAGDADASAQDDRMNDEDEGENEDKDEIENEFP